MFLVVKIPILSAVNPVSQRLGDVSPRAQEFSRTYPVLELRPELVVSEDVEVQGTV